MIAWRDVNALYQIYPRSFKDSDGDGVGDLRGVIEKLPYLKGEPESLGVDAIWLSPFFTSPMADFGYDISNYRDVDPLFGTLDDFKELLEAAHARDIRVVIDYVPNHTSSQHPWFQEALKGRDNPYRKYYVWADPAPDGGPPNNWRSSFFGSAWEFDETSGQYYLHSFLPEQPDLDWTNPAVRREMSDVLRFWMEIGVDGFRADAVWCLSKDIHLRDNPTDPDYYGAPGAYGSYIHRNSKQGPELFAYLSELTKTVAEFEDRRIIFEYYADHKFGNVYEQFRPFYTEIDNSVGLPFNIEGIHQNWTPHDFGAFLDNFHAILEPGDLPIYCFGNHDQPRIASKYGERRARMIALMQLTLPGLPTIYNGDEIGMVDGYIQPHEIRDPSAAENAMGGRDPQRTPMQWNDEDNAGFSASTPWLPIPESYRLRNVESQIANPSSFLSLYSMLLHLRRIDRTLIDGDFQVTAITDEILSYRRQSPHSSYEVIMNFSEEAASVDTLVGDILFLTNDGDVLDYSEQGRLTLKPQSAALLKAQIL